MVSFHSFFSPPDTKIEHTPDNLSLKKRKWPHEEEVDVALQLRPPASTIHSDERQESNNQALKKLTRGHPRQLMSSPPKSLDLRLNLSSQSNLGNHWSTITSLVPAKDVAKEKEMVAVVCSLCNMLVMLCKSSPSCPNCKFLHHPLQSTFRH